MDRFGGRFGRGGRFNRGGRENFQYRKKDEGNDRFRNYNERESKEDWEEGGGNNDLQMRQEQRQDQRR